MTDQITNISLKEYVLAIGVTKYDFKRIGYPDIVKLANTLKSDENFLQVIVRRVSEENFGIQFIYRIPVDVLSEEVSDWKYFKTKQVDLLSNTYATDIAFVGQNSAAEFVVMKPFMVDND